MTHTSSGLDGDLERERQAPPRVATPVGQAYSTNGQFDPAVLMGYDG